MTDTRGVSAAYLKAVVAVVVWGASFIATKIALRELEPMVVVWLRFGIGTAILGTIAGFRRKLSPVPLKTLGYFTLLGFLGITFHQWLQSTGLLTAEATTTAWVVATIPVMIAILGRVALKERLTPPGIAGIILSAFGVLLVVSNGDLRAVMRGSFGTIGDFLILVSALNWAVFSVLSRDGLKHHHPTQMMFYVMSTGWLFVTMFVAVDGTLPDLSGLTSSAWASVAFLGIFCSGLAYIFWYDALKLLHASRVGSLIYLEPIVAVVVAASLLEETVSIPELAGGALVLIGVWLVNRKTIQAGPV